MNSDNLNKLTPHLAFLCQFFVGEGGEKSKGGAAVLGPGQNVLKGKGLRPGQNLNFKFQEEEASYCTWH